MAAADSVQPAGRYISTNRPIGNLHKGHGKVAASASIPSKYQTIVISNNEKKGFNSGSKRFGLQQVDGSPGPAKYITTGSLLKENNASYSKKGLGGFVSKVKRFPVPLNEDVSVGPGQYNPNLKICHDFNKATCTSNFHKPIAVQQDSQKFQTPGPNQYNLSSKPSEQMKYENDGPRPAFLSRTRRELLTAKIAESAPAPGAYNISDRWTTSNPRAAQAPFKSNTNRNMFPKTLMENPGPGTYNPYEPQVCNFERRGLPRKHYLCISAPAVPMPPQPPTPGPGQYNLVNYEGPSKHYVSSSMFVSTTNRWDVSKPISGPGPGAYNPHHFAKQSFIYNSEKKWI